jgi:hypothetical protein
MISLNHYQAITTAYLCCLLIFSTVDTYAQSSWDTRYETLKKMVAEQPTEAVVEAQQLLADALTMQNDSMA